MSEPMSPALRKALDNVLDTFGGAGGGLDYLRFQCLVKQLEYQHVRGDSSAGMLLDIVYKFSRLIDLSRKADEYAHPMPTP